MISVIGDCHGKTIELVNMLKRRSTLQESELVIQCGDMGLGFRDVSLPELPKSFGFIRGNHDNPDLCRMHPNYLGDFGYIEKHKLFYIGGAFSIDWKWRTPGVSWWDDEELSYEAFQKAIDLYKTVKPEIVVSHDIPKDANWLLLHNLSGEYFSAKMECAPSRTCGALQQMLEEHQPKHWIFGHYHVDKDFNLRGTHFHCCAELSEYQIPNLEEI